MTFLVFIEEALATSYEVLKVDRKNYSLSLEHDTASNSIRLNLENDSLSKVVNRAGPFSIVSPSDVEDSVIQIKSFLNAYDVDSKDIETIISRVSEYRFFSKVSCEALHFSVESNIQPDSGSIDSLLGEITKITSFDNNEHIPSRSLLIDTFDIGENNKIQLRMVLDQNGDFLSFSFSKESGTMDGLKWYSKGSAVYLKNKRGDVVLSVDLENFNHRTIESAQGGLILVKSPKDSFIENEKRTYIRLTSNISTTASDKKEKSWKVDRYNTQHFKANVARDGVALSSSFARHTPVVQLHGSDIYFPKLDSDSLFLKYRKENFPSANIIKIEDSYNECMGERTSLAGEQSFFGHNDLNIAESDNIIFCERLALINHDKAIGNLTFRSCLIKSNLLQTKESFEYLNYNHLTKMSDEDFENSIVKCRGESYFTETERDILQKIEDFKLVVSENGLETLKSSLRQCFDQLGNDICRERGIKLIEGKAILSFLKSIGHDESQCAIDFKIKENESYFEQCYEISLENALASYDDTFFRNGVHELGSDLSSLFDSNDVLKTKDAFNSCMIRELKSESSYIDKKDKWFEFEQFCLSSSLKEKVIYELNQIVSSKVGDLIGWMENDELRNQISTDLRNEILNLVTNWQDISNYSELKEEVAISTYSFIGASYLTQRISEISDPKFQQTIKSFLLGSDSEDASPMAGLRLTSRSINRKITSTLRAINSNDRLTYLKNLIKTTELNASNFTLSSEESISEETSQALKRTEDTRRNCLEEISVAQNTKLTDEMISCKIQDHTILLLEKSRIEFEKMISDHFLAGSSVSSRLMGIVSDLKGCLENFSTMSYFQSGQYKKLMQGCYHFAKLQLQQEINQEKIFSYRPMVEGVLEEYQSCSLEIFKDSLNTGKDFIQLRDISSLNIISERDSFLNDFETQYTSYDELLKSCDEQMEKEIVSKIKDFFIQHIPSLSSLADEEKNRGVIGQFFDDEMVKLLLSFSQLNDSKESGASIDLGSLVSEERVLTKELGTSSLVNFLSALGSYFDKGFIYDESGMRTELIVFKSELKDFLRWYNSNPDQVTIREAKAFFSQSELGEHLAMAVISEDVYTKFTTGINTMRGEEVREFFSKTSCKTYWSCFEKDERGRNSELKASYDSLIQKYDGLLTLTKQMTSSYDFRRIIRPETAQGEKIISLAHDAVVAPEVLGVAPNANSQEELMNEIGKAILADNTDGGFSERFVEEVVRHSMREEEMSKSTLGKWLFYDKGDFDWELLRKTQSGREALNYYTRFIMLPRMLGESETRYMRNLRKSQFEKLMRQAQNESEH